MPPGLHTYSVGTRAVSDVSFAAGQAEEHQQAHGGMNSVRHTGAWLLLLHACAACTSCKLSCIQPDDVCWLLRSNPQTSPPGT